MRILLVQSALFVGGMERQMLTLTRGLIQHGHTVDVAVPYAGDHHQRTFEELGARVVILLGNASRSWSGPVRALRVPHRVLALRKAIGEGAYDIVHGYGVSSNIYASVATLRLQTRVVWGIRDSLPLQSRSLRLLERVLLPFADLTIASSQAGRRVCLARGFPERRTIAIENGIDMHRFRIEPAWRTEVRQELGISDAQPLIGVIGRVDPVKNVRGFLQAAAVLAARHDDARFVIVGPGDPKHVDALKHLADDLGITSRIIWTGPRDDPERYYNALDVLLSPTIHKEGMMNVAIEAMACGTPCVVTDVGDVAVVVGNLGCIVPPHEPEVMADAVDRLLVNEAGWTREMLRASVADRYAVPVLIDRTERALEALVRGRQPAPEHP